MEEKMNAGIGFDNDLYLKRQTAAILERVKNSGTSSTWNSAASSFTTTMRHGSCPGYDPNVKMRLLRELKDQADIILCIYAGDIERRKVRADFGITYDTDALKLIDDLRGCGIDVRAVVITRFENQPSARVFKNKLERRDVKVYTHRFTKGYPTDVDTIVSDEGYGANEYIETHKPLVIVTGPGPGSGKLATCLSQLYHDYRRGRKSGYAKFETFPIWNLPLKHPVNIAYEAATADIGDFNLIDPFHLEAYGKTGRQLQPGRRSLPGPGADPGEDHRRERRLPIADRNGRERAPDSRSWTTPCCRKAAQQEIVRRYFRYRCEYAMGLADRETVERAELLMKELSLVPEDRCVVAPAREAAARAVEEKGKGHRGVFVGAAIELRNGTIVTGKNSSLMHAASSLVLNAVKKLAEIPERIHLLSPGVIDSVGKLKENVLGAKSVSLDVSEVLIA